MDDGHRSSRMENRAARIMHRGCKVPSTPSNTRNRILLDLDEFVSAYTHQSEAESGDVRRVNVPRDDNGTSLFVSIIQATLSRRERKRTLSFPFSQRNSSKRPYVRLPSFPPRFRWKLVGDKVSLGRRINRGGENL